MSRYNRLKQPRSNSLSLRSLVVLFVATMAISLLLLMILFNLVFKNIDLNFKTRLPESAPTPEQASAQSGALVEEGSTVSSDTQARFEAEGIMTARMNVPGRRQIAESVEPVTLDESAIEDTQTLNELNNDDAPLTTPVKSVAPTPALPPVSLESRPPSTPLTGAQPPAPPPPPGMTNPATAPESPLGGPSNR